MRSHESLKTSSCVESGPYTCVKSKFFVAGLSPGPVYLTTTKGSSAPLPCFTSSAVGDPFFSSGRMRHATRSEPTMSCARGAGRVGRGAGWGEG